MLAYRLVRLIENHSERLAEGMLERLGLPSGGPVRIHGARGKRLLRKRGELLERPCAHLYETGGLRRAHTRGHENVLKRLLVHASAFNLGLWMRSSSGSAHHAVSRAMWSRSQRGSARFAGSHLTRSRLSGVRCLLQRDLSGW